MFFIARPSIMNIEDLGEKDMDNLTKQMENMIGFWKEHI